MVASRTPRSIFTTRRFMSKSFRQFLIGLLLLQGVLRAVRLSLFKEVLDAARTEYVAILKTSADSEPAKGPLLELSKTLESLAGANGAGTAVGADSVKGRRCLDLAGESSQWIDLTSSHSERLL